MSNAALSRTALGTTVDFDQVTYDIELRDPGSIERSAELLNFTHAGTEQVKAMKANELEEPIVWNGVMYYSPLHRLPRPNQRGYAIFTYPKQDANSAQARVIEGYGVFNSMTQGNPLDDAMTVDFTFTFEGLPEETDEA